jgi:hypothetical protein
VRSSPSEAGNARHPIGVPGRGRDRRALGRTRAWETGPRRRRRPWSREDSTIAHRDPDRRLALTLHIGSGKTGTTSLQSFLDRNRDLLADAGWLYPRSIGRTRHAQFGVWTRPDRELGVALRERRPGTRPYDDVAQLRREVPRRLLAEVGRTGLRQVLISDEALYGSSVPSLERLRRFCDEQVSRLRLVCYLRRQDDHLVSRYQQVVKVRETRTLVQRVAEMDLAATYDYHARLQAWLRVVEPDELVVRRFERDRFVHGSLYDDFVDAAGLGIATDDLPPRERNESLDAESVEFLRLLNLYREESGDTDLPENRTFLRPLSRLSTGPTLTLPEADLDRFMAQWTDSNERVARELLREPDGELFSAPRKGSHTTTEQRLDPARLGRYLEALDTLPDRVAAPLRVIAEREAHRP